MGPTAILPPSPPPPLLTPGVSLFLQHTRSHMGSIVGMLLAPAIINVFGWPALFWSFGSAGAVW